MYNETVALPKTKAKNSQAASAWTMNDIPFAWKSSLALMIWSSGSTAPSSVVPITATTAYTGLFSSSRC